MKLFIIEGPDNTGKTHFAHALENYLKNNGLSNVLYIHFDAPKSSNFKEAAKLEHEFSINIAKQIRAEYSRQFYDAIILDRSWYSEYVYGNLYRKRTLIDCHEKIRSVEDIIINTFEDGETYYVYMTASPEFLANHEDGKSLSNAEIDMIKKENHLFDNLLKQVMMDNIVVLNVEGEDNNYTDIKTQLETVIKF